MAEPFAGKRDALTGDQFAVEPSRSVMADLLVEAGGRHHTDPDVGTVTRQMIGGDAPVIRVDPLGMTSAVQCLQPADMGANERLGIAAGAVDYALFVTGDLERFVLDPRLNGGPFAVTVDVIGAAISSRLRNRIARTVTERIIVTYGTNEVHHISVVDGNNVGTLFPGVRVMIVDDHGQPVPPGETGLIRIRSDTMTDGYLGAPALTAAAFLDGWYHTNDIGFQPSPGTLVVMGRADDMLNVGGMKVPPGPVVEQIRTIDGVLDAMVTSVVNARGIEVLLVAVETGLGGDRSGLEAAINPIIQRYASRYVLLPLPAFPRTETRKIRQDAVRAAYAALRDG